MASRSARKTRINADYPEVSLQTAFLLSAPTRSGAYELHPRHALRVLVIDLAQDLLREPDTVNSPAALDRCELSR
jgi:hypothetical protein